MCCGIIVFDCYAQIFYRYYIAEYKSRFFPSLVFYKGNIVISLNETQQYILHSSSLFFDIALMRFARRFDYSLILDI